jgi:hypothetical protein
MSPGDGIGAHPQAVGRCPRLAPAVAMSDYEGIVVLGAPRSGTTLLRKLLSAHPRIHAPAETNLLSACARFLEETPSGHGLSIGARSGLAFSGIEEDAVLGALRELVFGFWRRIAAQAGKPIWAEKTAFDSFHLDEIEQLLGDRCRYVIVVRHGLDAVASMKELADEMETYLPEVHPYVRAHLSPHVAFAHAWVDVNRRLLAFEEKHAPCCIRVRYEDLVADGPAVMSRIFDFLGEPADVAAVIAAGTAREGAPGLGDWKTHGHAGIEAGSVGRWRNLTASTIARLAAVANPTLAALGYEPVVPPKAASGAAARRQYQIHAAIARMRSDAEKKA